MLTYRKLTAPRPIVYPLDPALDRDAPDFDARWQAYEEDFDVARLPVRAGCALTFFDVASLTVQQAAHADSADGLGRRILETLAYGVHDVRNVDGLDAVRRRDTDLGKRLPDEVLALFVDDALRIYLYKRVRDAGSLTSVQRKSD